MAGGYGGQEIALDVNDSPLSIVSPLEQWQQYQSQGNLNDYRSAMTAGMKQQQSQNAQLFPSQLEIAKNTASQNTAATQRSQLAEAMAQVDPTASDASVQWKAQMQKLADGGNPIAAQLVDAPYTPQKQKEWTAALTASNPATALGQFGQDPTALPQLSPEQTQAFDLRYADASPQQLQQGIATAEKVRDAMRQVLSSSNPGATWDQLAPTLGHPELVGKYSPQNAQQMWGQVSAQDAYLQQRLSNTQTGMGSPVIPGQVIKRDDGSLVRVDAAGHSTVLQGPTEKWTAAPDGVNEINSRTGETRPIGSTQPAGAVGPIYDQIAQVASQIPGATPQDIAALRRQALVESSGNPTAVSKAGKIGLFQFDQDTFNRYGGGDINSVADQTKAALNMLHANQKLAAGAGAAPTAENAYVVAQQGSGGGPALLAASTSSPDTKAVDVLTPIYQAGGRSPAQARAIATQAVTNNGGSPDMSCADFVNHVRGQFDQASSGSGGSGSSAPDSVVAPGFKFPANYNEATFQRMALQDFTTGKEPTFPGGRAFSANATASYREYKTDLMNFMGISQGDLNDKATMNKAFAASTNKLVGLQGQVNANEEAASRNADLAVDQMKKMGATGIPALNTLQMAVRKGVGDSSVPQYQVALGTFLDEYAKVMSTNTGAGGVTSDSARNEAYSRISKSSTPDQLAGAIATLKQDMANKQQGIQDSIDGMRAGQRNLVPTVPNATHAAQAPAPDSDARWPGHTTAQLIAAQAFRGSTAPQGSQGNPYTVASTDAAKALLAHVNPTPQNPLFVIDPQGNVRKFP